MKHYSINASQEDLAILADAISQSNLGDKISQFQNQMTSSFAFANGDKLTITSGFARVAKMSQLQDGKRVTVPYLVFDATVQHANGSVEPCTVSLRQLVQPTIVTAEPSAEGITRNQLVKRFGNIPVAYRDTRDSNGNVVTLPCLEQDKVIEIVTGKAWIPDFASYDGGVWKASTSKENYGYAKA